MDRRVDQDLVRELRTVLGARPQSHRRRKVPPGTVAHDDNALGLCSQQSGMLQAPGVGVEALLGRAGVGCLGGNAVVDGHNDGALQLLRQGRQVDIVGLGGQRQGEESAL